MNRGPVRLAIWMGATLSAAVALAPVRGVVAQQDGSSDRGAASDDNESDEKKDDSAEKPLLTIRRESSGVDIVPGPLWDPACSGPIERALKIAQVHIKFGVFEHGNVQAFDDATLFLDLAGKELVDSDCRRTVGPPQTIESLRSETARMRRIAHRTVFGRFPLIRALDLNLEDEPESQVRFYRMPGEARRTAVREALTQIGKSASTMPLDVIVLVPGESGQDRQAAALSDLVDAESPSAFAKVPNLMLFLGMLREQLDPMPAWDSPDPAFDPVCRQFLKRISPANELRSLMIVMVREFTDESHDGYWVQAQQRTFEASSLEKAEDDSSKLENDKARIHETLAHDKSRFNLAIIAGIAALFLLSLCCHAALSIASASHFAGWQKWLVVPTSGFLMGMILMPLIMLTLQRWLPPPDTPVLSGGWWPCAAGALALVLPAGVFRLGAGSAGRYLPSLYCHGRWGIAFVPVALGAAAAWIRPALFALGYGGIHVAIAIAATAALLAYCFGRAIDAADQFPVALTPLALAQALLFGAGAFLGSPVVLWSVSGSAALVICMHWLIAWRRRAQPQSKEESSARRDGAIARRPRTLEQLRATLDEPHYQPPREFERLRRGIERSGVTEAVWIGFVGPAAVGKTAAARHLIGLMQAEHDSVQVLVGHCTEGSPPYQPFREALEELGVSSRFLAAQGGNVDSIFERLADELIPFWDFFSVDSNDEGDKESSRIDLLAGVANALHTLAQNQRVILFLDDVQWIDEGSAAVLKHLRESFAPGSDTSLTIIVASRDPKAVDQLGLKDTVVSLSPPTAAELVRFLDQSLGIEIASARYLVNALGVLSHEAGGMFWLIRAVRELAAANAFRTTPKGFVLRPEYLKRGPLPVPAAMRAKLAESLRASGPYQPVLECAALLGEKFRVDDVAECLELDRLKLLHILRHLDRELQLVRDIPSDQECYAFSSTFMLEIVRQELGVGSSGSKEKHPSSKVARELHGRIAGVLKRRTPRTAELVYATARHCFEAGISHASESIELCLEAARLARKAHATKDARRYLAMAEQSARLARRVVDFSSEKKLIDAQEASPAAQEQEEPADHASDPAADSGTIPSAAATRR